jgi:hypothetical protein
MIKLKKMRWIGHIERIGTTESAYKFQVQILEAESYVGDMDLD